MPERTFVKKRVLIATMEVIGPSKGGGIATAYTAMAETLAKAGHDVYVLYTERYNLGDWNQWVVEYASKNIGIMRLWDDIPSASANIDVGGPGCTTRACSRSYRVYLWLKERVGKNNGNGFEVVHFHDNGGIGYFTQLAKHQGEVGFADMVFFHGAHGPHLWERYDN